MRCVRLRQRCVLLMPLPTSLLLLQLLQLSVSNTNAKVIIHFGGCTSTLFGIGKCLPKNQCEFYNVDVLEREQCESQLRRGLICCPNSPDRLPLISARGDQPTVRPTVQPTVQATVNPADVLPTAPNCGLELGNRIHGGTKTNILEFPWTVLLQYTSADGAQAHNCGGSFIAQRWILTAAHCVLPKSFPYGYNLTGVRLGEWDQTTDPDCVTFKNGRKDCVASHVDVRVDRILPHADFDDRRLDRDIALLRLERPIDWRLPRHHHIAPICLPLKPAVRDNMLQNYTVDVAGWGRTEFNDTRSMVKRKAMLRVWSLDECRPLYAEFGFTLDETQLCASGGNGVDTCRGDSGGPLMYEEIDAYSYYILAGIVSFGKIACGENDFPGVYTRVGAHIDWIRTTIEQNSQ